MLSFLGGDLLAVDSVHLSVQKNFSETNLMLFWDEPSLSSRPSVDYYLVGVNQVELMVTSPRAIADVIYSGSLNITIRYSNCLELSPTAKFNLSLLEGIKPVLKQISLPSFRCGWKKKKNYGALPSLIWDQALLPLCMH